MKRDIANIAKITRPQLSGSFPRKRLFRRLDKGVNVPVTWVMGPAGSGKTTLVASYLDEKKLRSLWYRVDEGDADLATFFYYLGLAGEKASPRYKKPLPLFTPEYLMGIPAFSKRYFEGLFSRLVPSRPLLRKGDKGKLAQERERRYFLVFDNYQDAAETSPFHDVVQNGLSSIPRGINVIVISRNAPPDSLAGLRAKNGLDVIDWEEIRFTADESAGMLRLRDRKITSEEAQYIHQRTQGWAAGMVLMTEGARTSSKMAPQRDRRSREKLFSYFAGEILSSLDSDTRDFLLISSFLPNMSELIARKLTGNDDAGRILSRMNRQHFFTEKHAGRDSVYQYHPLFREFLQTRITESLSPDDLTRVQRNAAELLVEAGEPADAAGLFIAANDWQSLINLVLRHAPLFMAQGRSALLEAWFESMPQELVERIPWIIYWKAVCRMPFNPRESQESFEKALHLFEEGKDTAGVFLAWAGVVESVFLAFENLTQLDTWIDTLPSLEQRYGSVLNEEIEGRVASAMVAAIAIRQLPSGDFDSWLNKALAVNDLNLKIKTLFYHAFRHICQGHIAQCWQVIDSLHALAKTRDVAPLGLIHIKLIELMVYEHCGLPDQYANAANEGLRIADQSGVHVSDSFLVCHGANAALALGDFASARMWLERTAAAYDHISPLDKGFFHLITATEAYLLGDSKKALAHIEPALISADQVGQPSSSIWCLSIYALILRDLGDSVKADELLLRLLRLSHDVKCESGLFEYYMTKAQFDLDRGKQQEALSHLRKALAIGKEWEFFWTYMVRRPSDLSNLAIVALENQIEVEYVRELIRRRKLVPEALPQVESWPWPIKIKTLGEFKLIRDEKPFHYSRKAPKKALELLRAVIALGGRNVSEQRLMDALWPDAEGDLGRKSLSVTLMRLRELLGVKDVLRVSEGAISLDERLVWTDIHVVETLLRQSATAGQEGNNDEAAEMREKAVSHYHGDFLGNEPASWAISPRERLRELFLRAVEALGQHWEQGNEWQKAIGVYERGIEADDLNEVCYIGKMSCLLRLGSPAKALSVFRRLKKTLDGYGVAPSADVEELHRRILSRTPAL